MRSAGRLCLNPESRGNCRAMWNILERLELAALAPRQPRGPLPVPGQPPGTDLLPEIRHIVVLMMENHSYDNYLGMLRGRGEGLPLGPDGQPVAANTTSGGEVVRAHRMSSTVQQPDVPSQSWHACHLQWGEGRCDGFVTATETVLGEAGATKEAIAAAADVAMGYWTEAELPFYSGLARTFPVADHWFSSCLGPTFPNRRFLIAGTAHGLIDDSPYDLLDYPAAGTIFDMLSRHRISWANYHPVGSGTPLTRYARHKRKMARRRLQSAGRILTDTGGALKKDITFTADVFPVGTGRLMSHIRSTQEFFAAADAGQLPAVSIVDPDFELFSEENPQDVRWGESFAAEVISHVLHGPGWPHTLLIWTYDEHGGYYDHVPPPPAVPPDDILGRSLVGHRTRLAAALRPLAPRMVRDKENMTRGPLRYDQYGIRVPAVIVSPYARRDFVLSDVLDHTSVLRLIEDKWNLPPLTARDAAARSPLAALDLDSPPAFLKPPDLPAPSLPWGSW
jgi:phospholipase C